MSTGIAVLAVGEGGSGGPGLLAKGAELLLIEGEQKASEFVAALGQTQGRISNHLACLRWCGYIDSRREGKYVYYRVSAPRVRRLQELTRAVMADHAAAILSCTRI